MTKKEKERKERKKEKREYKVIQAGIIRYQVFLYAFFQRAASKQAIKYIGQKRRNQINQYDGNSSRIGFFLYAFFFLPVLCFFFFFPVGDDGENLSGIPLSLFSLTLDLCGCTSLRLLSIPSSILIPY